jgi:hypothetical protein
VSALHQATPPAPSLDNLLLCVTERWHMVFTAPQSGRFSPDFSPVNSVRHRPSMIPVHGTRIADVMYQDHGTGLRNQDQTCVLIIYGSLRSAIALSLPCNIRGTGWIMDLSRRLDPEIAEEFPAPSAARPHQPPAARALLMDRLVAANESVEPNPDVVGGRPAYLPVGDLGLFIDEDTEYAPCGCRRPTCRPSWTSTRAASRVRPARARLGLAQRFICDRDDVLRRARSRSSPRTTLG